MLAFQLALAVGSALCFSLYAGLVYTALIIWRQQGVVQSPRGFVPHTFISVVVPARNEAAHLPACLESLLAQDYPERLYEIIVVDDHSTDDTPRLVRERYGHRVRLLQLATALRGRSINAYKKAALTLGIREAWGELIVTTDADCLAGPRWLHHLAAAYEQGAPILAGPVRYRPGKGLLGRFQALDNAGMQVLTGAGLASGRLLLANGANLAYPKALFEKLGGFRGLDKRASGDDMLWVQRAVGAGHAIRYLRHPEAVITTHPQPNWAAFLQQRIRWASKFGALRDPRLWAAQIIAFALCALIFLNYVLGLFGDLFALLLFFALLAGKSLLDYPLLREGTRFLEQPRLLRAFLPAQLLHIGYVLLAGLGGLFTRRYMWKGRRVR